MDVEHGTAGKKRLKKKRAASAKIKKKPKVKRRRARRQPRQTQRQKQTVNIKMGTGYGGRYNGPSNWSPFVVGAAMNTVQQPPINLTFVGEQGAFQADRRHNASASPIPAAAPPRPMPAQHAQQQPAPPPRAHPQNERRAMERAFAQMYRPIAEEREATATRMAALKAQAPMRYGLAKMYGNMKEKRAQELSTLRRNMQSRISDMQGRISDPLSTPTLPAANTALDAGISPGGHEGRNSASEVQLWRRAARNLMALPEEKK